MDSAICKYNLTHLLFMMHHHYISNKEIKTAFTRCRRILKTVKNVTVAKFELAFTRYRHNLKTVGNLTVKLVARLWCQRNVPTP